MSSPPPPPPPPPPPTITPETVQVNEANDIITWQPPAEPNGQILHYNIRIYRVEANGNEELVDTVREVQGTTYDFSTRGLSGGTYNIQVSRTHLRVCGTDLREDAVCTLYPVPC